MPKIKHTKNELKTQRDALLRFRRYLPTLELKKQQLQVEVRRLQRALEEKQAEYDRLMAGLESWVALFAEDAGLETLIRLAAVRVSETNIAGISIPVFQEAVFERKAPDLFDTPPWIDDAMDFLESAQRVLIEKRILGGNDYARLIVDAMVYQIAKEIGAMFAACGCAIEAVVLTGGMVRSEYVRGELQKRAGRLAPVLVFDQPLEMEALAAGALRVLNGESEALRYLWNAYENGPEGESIHE